jgi:uncharacterized cupredoxin-like copper-binding protein
MIWRIWIGLTVVVVVGAWVWMVPLSPLPMTKTTSAIDDYRDKGLVPKVGALVDSEEVGHDIFEVPPGDAEERARIIAALGQVPVEARAEEEGHEIRLDDDEEVGEAVATAGEVPDARDQGHGAGGVDVGITILAKGSAAEVAPVLGRLDVDRTVEVEMREWGYSPEHVMVEPGEVIRLVVSNAGALPHEFMLMDGVGMQAVDYRLDRADWNLLEHEAIYEVPVVMPGGSFELVAKIHKAGMWMYMCMFPYHMEQGMMGMFMTAGVSMDGMGDRVPPPSAEGDVEGVGVVVSVALGEGRVVLDHEAIEGYMGAMEMSYMVTPASLLEGIKAGDKVRFTIDTQKRMIVGVTVE